MEWETLLASVTGKINRESQLKIAYLITENKILRDQISGKPRFTDEQRIALATIGAQLGKAALRRIAGNDPPLAQKTRRPEVRYQRAPQAARGRQAADR